VEAAEKSDGKCDPGIHAILSFLLKIDWSKRWPGIFCPRQYFKPFIELIEITKQ
jgi:hypothetical protein